MPTAETSQRLAAVVRPRTRFLVLMIVPAPRNPMPETIAARRWGKVE